MTRDDDERQEWALAGLLADRSYDPRHGTSRRLWRYVAGRQRLMNLREANQIRADRGRLAQLGPPRWAAVHDPARADRAADVGAALAQLPAVLRELARGVFWDGLTWREAGARLGLRSRGLNAAKCATLAALHRALVGYATAA